MFKKLTLSFLYVIFSIAFVKGADTEVCISASAGNFTITVKNNTAVTMYVADLNVNITPSNNVTVTSSNCNQLGDIVAFNLSSGQAIPSGSTGIFISGTYSGSSSFTLSAPYVETVSPAGTPSVSVCSSGGTLPVELQNFQAQAQNKTNLLNWQTASEKDNEGFYIQQSVEGKNFKTLGFVKGQGTTNEKQSYSYTDDAPLPISYYRLRQVDFDGKESFSKIVSVQAGEKGQYKIYPNPAKEVVNVQFQAAQEGVVELDLYDSAGKLIQHYNYNAREGENQSVLKVQNIAKGFYTLKIKQGEAVVSERLIID
jgi:hypothetical protein